MRVVEAGARVERHSRGALAPCQQVSYELGEPRHLSDYDFQRFARLVVVGLVQQGDVRLDLSASVLMVFLLAVPAMESSFRWPGMA